MEDHLGPGHIAKLSTKQELTAGHGLGHITEMGPGRVGGVRCMS